MKYRACALAALLLLGLPTALFAGCCLGPRLGLRAGYALPAGLASTYDLGLYARSNLPLNFEFEPNIEYWTSEGISLLTANADLRYRFKVLGGFLHPFLGAGLGVGRLWNRNGILPLRFPPRNGLELAGLAGVELTFLPLVNFVVQGRYSFFPDQRVLALTLGVDFGF